jgi:hypothetical protein
LECSNTADSANAYVVFGYISIGENRYRDVSGATDDRRFVVNDELLTGHFT